MKIEKVEFQGHDGSPLAARLDRPHGGVRAAAVFAHCFTCTKDIAAARRISAELAGLGIAVLRFDFTGLGHSGGEFANTSFSSNVDDLALAARWLDENVAPTQLAIGHSLGGAAVIAAAPQLAHVRAIAVIGAPHEPEHVLQNFGASLDAIERDGEAEVSLAGRPFRIGKGFVEDIRGASLDRALGSLRKALLVLHAPTDATVGIENAGRIFTAAKHPKSFVSLDGADHLLSRAADAQYAAQMIAAWADRYLSIEPAAKGPEAGVRVIEADADGFLQDVLAADKHILADEPRAYGGTDLGLTPYQLLAAGLGACTSMTIRMYARRKKFPLTGVSVDVSHDKVHAEDCDGCETAVRKIDRFERVVAVEGDLTDDQRAKLLEIADKCPVHRTLERASVIETRLAAPPGATSAEAGSRARD